MPWAVPQAWCWRTQGPWGDLPVLLRGCSAGDPALRGVTVYSAHKQTFGLAVDKQISLFIAYTLTGCKLPSYHTDFKHQGIFAGSILIYGLMHQAAVPFLLKGQGAGFVSRIWFLHALGLIHYHFHLLLPAGTSAAVVGNPFSTGSGV